LEYAKYVVPASASSQKVAYELIRDDSSLTEKILFDHVDDFVKKGTLGASYDEVRDGIEKALETDCNLIVAIGEAATKFKSCVDDL
jgi:UDP-N-acetylmuramate--alanine ligase